MKIPFPAIMPPPPVLADAVVAPSDFPAVAKKDLQLKFRAGTLCLYLVETRGEWTKRRFERIPNGDIWRDWLRHVELPQPDLLVSEEDLAHMRYLRTAIYAVVQAVRQGNKPPSAELACLNYWAGCAPPPLALDASGTTLDSAQTVSQHQILALIARDAVTLLSGPLRGRIRECASTICPVLFVDRSRRGDRIWCSAGCGARLATARYRRRHATPSEC